LTTNWPTEHSPLAPGMSMTVYPGEEYTLTDNQGKDLQILGRDDDTLIAFVKAFYDWKLAATQHGPESYQARRAWYLVEEVYKSLPARVVKQLRSPQVVLAR
jgi:hypothetical protein